MAEALGREHWLAVKYIQKRRRSWDLRQAKVGEADGGHDTYEVSHRAAAALSSQSLRNWPDDHRPAAGDRRTFFAQPSRLMSTI